MIKNPSNRMKCNTRFLKPGVILKERYKIEEVIGAGGFGITYRAWDPLLQEYVAIKEYYPLGIATRDVDSIQVCVPVGDEQREYHRGLIRFLKEAQDVARFQAEPNIVSIYDYLEENDTAYMVMEYLHGCTLKQYVINHGGKLNTDYILHICLSLLDALAVVHEAEMIHRDISPENVFVCDDLTVKLIDFGAAKQVYLDGEQTISVVLKPGYAPPEQYAKKNKQGSWTDIYALGATLYYAATGVKPEDSFGRASEDNVRSVSEMNPEIPSYLSEIIMHAMAIQIEDRYPNVTAMREALLAGSEQEKCKENVNLNGKEQKNYLKIGKKFRVVSMILVLTIVSVGGWNAWLNSKTNKTGSMPTATSMDASTEQETATIADAQEKDGTELATATDEHEGKASDSPMVMHVPTKDELEEQEKMDAMLSKTASETERVSLDEFTFMENVSHGTEMSEDRTVANPYYGDCAKVRLKYYDSIMSSPPKVTDDLTYAYTLEKYDSYYGLYSPVDTEHDEWPGFEDYASWYPPEVLYEYDAFNLYFPLTEDLENGKYKLHYAYLDSDTYEALFQVTIEFSLNRDR